MISAKHASFGSGLLSGPEVSGKVSLEMPGPDRSFVRNADGCPGDVRLPGHGDLQQPVLLIRHTFSVACLVRTADSSDIKGLRRSGSRWLEKRNLGAAFAGNIQNGKPVHAVFQGIDSQ